eukprot:jgi/Ulvmu1/8396/UM042_0103.1
MAACECSSDEEGASPRGSDCSDVDASDSQFDHDFDLPLAERDRSNGVNTNSKRPSSGAASGHAAAPPAKKSCNHGAPRPAAKKPATKRVKASTKEPKKIAEVIADTAEAAETRPDVSEAVMSRIKKALALGLHCGGNEAEKKHAMQRATRLLQQHGLSQADVENLSSDSIESASGMVAVRLNDNFVRYPVWGRTVLSVAQLMSKSKCFTNKGDKNTKRCFKVTFYGLKANASMAAHIFEAAYNSVIHLATQEMSGQGARAMLDYRQGMVRGLYKIAKADEEEREKALETSRAAAAASAADPLAAKVPTAAATVKPDPDGRSGADDGSPEFKPVLGQRDLNAGVGAAAVKREPIVDSKLDDDGAPWRKVKPEPNALYGGGGAARKWKREEDMDEDDDGDQDDYDGYDDYDDVGDDSHCSSSGWGAGRGGHTQCGGSLGNGSGKAAGVVDKGKSGSTELQQLVLYDDKSKLAIEAVEKKIKIRKGKKTKSQIKDWAAYNKGQTDASKVNLGAKRITGKTAAKGAKGPSTARKGAAGKTAAK